MLNVRLSILIAMLALVAGPAVALTAVDRDTLDQSALGYVAQGDTLTYQHNFDPMFDPGINVSSVDSAWLYVAVVDDWNCSSFGNCMSDWFFQAEVAAIDLNSVSWATGSATASIFFGDVTATADLLNNNGVLDVSVSSGIGDFVVMWSDLVTTYTYDIALNTGGGGSGTSPMPEPSAALAFAIGALVIRGTVRRRQSG